MDASVSVVAWATSVGASVSFISFISLSISSILSLIWLIKVSLKFSAYSFISSGDEAASFIASLPASIAATAASWGVKPFSILSLNLFCKTVSI